jgi:hypothetical protein
MAENFAKLIVILRQLFVAKQKLIVAYATNIEHKVYYKQYFSNFYFKTNE